MTQLHDQQQPTTAPVASAATVTAAEVAEVVKADRPDVAVVDVRDEQVRNCKAFHKRSRLQ